MEDGGSLEPSACDFPPSSFQHNVFLPMEKAGQHQVPMVAGQYPGVETGDYKINKYWLSLAIQKVWEVGRCTRETAGGNRTRTESGIRRPATSPCSAACLLYDSEVCFLICLVEILICAPPTSQSHHEEGKTRIAKVPNQH